MVKKIYKDEEYYYCEICKLLYKHKDWAEKCENWCKENKSCNLDITKHAINKKENKHEKFI